MSDAAPGETLIRRSEIAGLIDPAAMLEVMRRAFASYSMERAVSARRFPVFLPRPAPEGAAAMILLPGLVAGIPAYTVKVHAKMPGHDPAIQGVIVLHDIGTGHPLAILESTLITALRTGLAGALGADVLARPDAAHAAIIGAGAQGVLQLECLSRVRRLEHVQVFDIVEGRAAAFAEREGARLGLDAHAC